LFTSFLIFAYFTPFLALLNAFVVLFNQGAATSTTDKGTKKMDFDCVKGLPGHIFLRKVGKVGLDYF